MAGNGSDALWAVDSVIGHAPDGSVVVKLTYKPPLSQDGNLIAIERLSSLPSDVQMSGLTGFYYLRSASDIGITVIQYDPYTDTIYRPTSGSSPVTRNKVINDFISSYIYKSYEFLRNPPSSVLSSEGLGGQILLKLQAYILAGISLGLSLYVLLIGYRAIDNFLYGVHKTYMQKKSARYIKSVMDESGGDPLGGSEKSSRSGVDPSIEFPPPR